jgi:hypothetical protein
MLKTASNNGISSESKIESNLSVASSDDKSNSSSDIDYFGISSDDEDVDQNDKY